MATYMTTPLTQEGIYLLQQEEMELALPELQKYAGVFQQVLGIAAVEATAQLKRANGIFRMPDRQTADGLSAALEEAGMKCFVVQNLLFPPASVPEGALAGPLQPGLIVASRVMVEKAETQRRAVRTGTFSRVMSESTKTSLEMAFVVDVMNREARVQKVDKVFSEQTRQWMSQMIEVAKGGPEEVHVNSGVTITLEGRRDLPRFQNQQLYERYITWLFNLYYAAKEE
jgi:hypothetical protein